MTLSADDLDRLERLAKAATSGPWSAQSYPVIDTFVLSDVDDDGYVCRAILPADGNYIATASPDVTLALVAEIREGRREREWRPIETAPKNGTPMLLLCDGPCGPASIGSWVEAQASRGWWVSHALRVHPTHWLPLPSAPATEPER